MSELVGSSANEDRRRGVEEGGLMRLSRWQISSDADAVTRWDEGGDIGNLSAGFVDGKVSGGDDARPRSSSLGKEKDVRTRGNRVGQYYRIYGS